MPIKCEYITLENLKKQMSDKYGLDRGPSKGLDVS